MTHEPPIDANEAMEETQEESVIVPPTQPEPDYKEQWLRAVADYQNLQKQTGAERSEWIRLSEAQVVGEFLPVYDNFKKAFAHKPVTEEKQWQNWANGIGFIMQQFGSILKAHDIEEMKTVGELFDPTKHDSVGEEPSADLPPGTIMREVDGGYLVKGKVMKVAKVIVAAQS